MHNKIGVKRGSDFCIICLCYGAVKTSIASTSTITEYLLATYFVAGTLILCELAHVTGQHSHEVGTAMDDLRPAVTVHRGGAA